VEDFRPEIRGLISRAIVYAGDAPHRVVVVSIPDWGVTPFNTSRDRADVARAIDAFNAVAREEATRAGAGWVDITDLTREAPGDVVADGLHPDAAMYRRWTLRLAKVASAILRQR
jgi:lysophospholipase L1-like esterase